RSRGGGTGSPAPACGPRCFDSAFLPPLLLPLFPPLAAPCCCFSLAMIQSSARPRNRVAALHADALLGSVLVDLAARARRFPLGVDEHHVRRMDRRRKLHDAALLVRRARAAMTLHHVHTVDGHAAGLREDLDDLPFFALVVAAHDLDGV